MEYRDFRPKYHFTPLKMWMNDPNGLVYENGRYHYFYQYHPYSMVWGPMHWGHAISTDLLNWEHLPIALAPDELGTIFSGSAVYDKDNLSGLGTADHPPIVAAYTSDGKAQTQCIAYSLDGITFEKLPENPVIENPGIRDFRDPKIFANPVRGGWSLVLAAGDRAHFYASQDLRHWEKTGEFGPEGNHYPGCWECTDCFPLSLDGEEYWVLVVSMNGADVQYFIGTFDGDTFRCTEPFGHAECLDEGRDFYAAVTYSGLPVPVMLGWTPNPRYASQVPTSPYRGQATLPRELSLIRTPEGIRVASSLYPELPCGEEISVTGEASLPGETFRVKLTADGPFSLTLKNEDGEQFVFGLGEDRNFFLDRTKGGVSGFNEAFLEDQYSNRKVRRYFDGPVDVDFVFDVSIAEIFADKGSRTFTSVVYPQKPYTSLSVSGAKAVLSPIL